MEQLRNTGQKMNTTGTILRISIYIRITFWLQTNLGMPDIFKGNPNHIGHCFTFNQFGFFFSFCFFCLTHQSPTKHTPQTPKGNAHVKIATIKEILLKHLQPIGTQMAAAGHLAFETAHIRSQVQIHCCVYITIIIIVT